MIIITNVDTEHFSYEGIRYYKNFTPEVKGGKVRLVNTYDNKMELMPLKDFSEVEVDGVVHGSLSALQNALIPVVWLSAVSFNGQIDTSAFERFANKGVANGYTPLDGSVKVDKSYLPTLEVTDINGLPAALNLYEEKSNKGVANGYASLDANGLVPSAQLPAYVDDVLEGQYINSTTFNDTLGNPYTGETGKIYVDTTSNKSYRFSGTVFIEIKDDAAVWGSITGSLSSQTDLQNALDVKANLSGGNLFNGDQLINGDVKLYNSKLIRLYADSGTTQIGYIYPTSGGFDMYGGGTLPFRFDGRSGGISYFTGILEVRGGIDATGQNITAGAFIGDGSQVDNVDAETLDGFDSTDFVRSTAGTTQSIDLGSGVLFIESSNGAPVRITNDEGTGTGLRFNDTGGNADIIWDSVDGFNLADNTLISGVLKSSSDISLNGGTGDFVSRDGSNGQTVTIDLTTATSITVKNGIITANA